jgi:hypothetical protein
VTKILAMSTLVLLCACRSETTRHATISCATPAGHVEAGGAAATLPGPLIPAPTASAYFPAGTFEPAVDSLVRDWFTKQLVAMREPPLPTLAADESVRFVWLRTFDKPIAVRVTRRGAEYELVAVRNGGAGGYEPGAVEAYRKLALEPAAWARVQAALTAAHFDTLRAQPAREQGLDGAQWVVERVQEGSYHLAERWQPKEKGEHAAFRALCDLLVSLAGPGLVTGKVY